MKNILYLLTFVIYQTTLGQSINDLDLKNGFRHFKLGSSPSQIKNIVKDENQYSKNPKITTYTYNGDDIKSVFNVNVVSITLDFFQDKLFGIGVSFGDVFQQKEFGLEDFKSIKSSLEQVYGIDWVNPTKNEVILNGAIWDGKNVRLELMRVDFSKKDKEQNSFVVGYIHVLDKSLTKQMYLSEF